MAGEVMDRLFLILSTVCFLGGFLYVVAGIRSGAYRPSRVNLTIMGLGFVFQCVYLWQLGQLRGRCPITNGFDLLIFVSWSMVLFYFLLGPPFRVSLLGVFTAPMVFLFQVGALLISGGKLEATPLAERGKLDPWLETHAALSLMGYGAFALACVAGVMYLVQDRQLKRQQLSNLFYSLPPITALGRTVFRLLVIGFVLLTAGIGSAFLMKDRPDVVHLLPTVAVWVVYGVLVGWQLVRGMGARKLALVSAWAFVLPVLTLLLLH
ncbi:MAG: cytochrome c biogenesis protein CcsA [Verrucomicrobiota bacterium]